MAVIESYSTLITATQDYLKRSDLATFVPNFVQNWEERFYRQPKNFGRWMETSLDATIASAVVPVPAAYLGLKLAYINANPSSRLERISLDQLYGRYPRGDAVGRPGWISRDTVNFVFGPAPDSDYNVRGVYWVKPVLIRNFATDASAHWIIVNAPDIALYGALLEAEPFMKNDARLQVWAGMYQQALKDYRDLHKEEETSGSAVQEVLA